jgi:hypothetical protein
MIRKWDARLAWWLNLANLHGCSTGTNRFEGEVLIPMVGGDDILRRIVRGSSRESNTSPQIGLALFRDWEHSVPQGFAGQVSRLEPFEHRPPGLDLFLRAYPPDDRAWSLAGIARALFVYLAEDASGEALVNFTLPSAGVLIARLSSDGACSLQRRDVIDPLIDLLDGRKDLIGKCPLCGQVFERLRKDQQCDTRRCRDAWRKRDWRKRQQDEENRKINRAVRERMISVGKASKTVKSRNHPGRGI